MVIMFGVAFANRARGGGRLVEEYNITEGQPRHVKFEKMPMDEPQKAVGWFYKYMGTAQFDLCARLFPEDLLGSLNLEQDQKDYEDGIYVKEYVIHGFQTLAADSYADQKAHYEEVAASRECSEYKVVRVHFMQNWSDKALEKDPQWGNGEYTRDFLVGKESGFRGKWKILELGMM